MNFLTTSNCASTENVSSSRRVSYFDEKTTERELIAHESSSTDSTFGLSADRVVIDSNGASIFPSISVPSSCSNDPRPFRANICAEETISKPRFTPLGLAGLTLPQIEKIAILETLLSCNGHRRKAAKKLGVSEKTIYNKIKQYKLDVEMSRLIERDNSATLYF